jgi:predicted Fe-Mo cluster-binding NifX family protein
MKICIPTHGDEGLEAAVAGHWGRAPFFTLVDAAVEALRRGAVRILGVGESCSGHHGEVGGRCRH